MSDLDAGLDARTRERLGALSEAATDAPREFSRPQPQPEPAAPRARREVAAPGMQSRGGQAVLELGDQNRTQGLSPVADQRRVCAIERRCSMSGTRTTPSAVNPVDTIQRLRTNAVESEFWASLERAVYPPIPKPPAAWRIRKLYKVWRIEKRLTDGWEVHRYCATGPDAFATFARRNR